MTVWIICDRRIGKREALEALIGGRINSIYFSFGAAESAAFPTEKVWAVRITARSVSGQ